MKKTVFIFAFITFCFFLEISSCKKDTPVTATTSYKVPEKVSFGKMKATIDGKTFDFNLTTAVEIMNGGVTSLKIVGETNDSRKTISLQISNVDALTVGSYFCGIKKNGDISNTVAYFTVTDSASYSCDGTATIGKIGITTISNSFIRGVFSFKAINSSGSGSDITISGEFNATHDKISAVEEGVIKSTVDGTAIEFNIVSAYRFVEGNTTSLAIEASANNGVDNLFILFKNIDNLQSKGYACASGSSEVSVRYYNSNDGITSKCDGSATSGFVSLINFKSTNAQGYFDVEANNPNRNIKISGVFNSKLISGTTTSTGRMRVGAKDSILCSAIRYYKNGKESIHIFGTSTDKTIQLNFDKIDTLINGIYNIDTSDTIILSSFTSIDGSFNSKIGQVVIYNYKNDVISGAFSYESENFGNPLIVSCEFSVEAKDVPPPLESKITLTSGGTDYNLSCNVVSDKTIPQFTISGINADNNKSITIFFNNDSVDIGTFNCIAGIKTLTYQLSTPTVKTYICDGDISNGSITISTYDGKTITGLFDVQVYNVDNTAETLDLTGSFSSSTITRITKK